MLALRLGTGGEPGLEIRLDLRPVGETLGGAEPLDMAVAVLAPPMNRQNAVTRHLAAQSAHVGNHGRKIIARDSLLRAQKLLAHGDYEAALKENQKALSLSGNRLPGDEALFNMGLIYAHSGNPKKDYGKSLSFLRKLLKDYPQSPRAERTKIWIEMLQENQKLNQAVEELNRAIEKSKQVDIEIEEKKRETTK